MSTRRLGVIGLGPMGGAIARVLIAHGHDVFAWNRTAEVTRRLPGANPTESAAALVREVDAIVVSLPSYRVTRELLETEDCEAALDGKLVVQLSTGGPQQARRQQAWAETHGASFLAGSVLGYPRLLGTEAMTVLYGGSRASFDDWASILAGLAPGQLFVGGDPGAPASLSGPLWHFYYGAFGAFLEAAASADASGIDLRGFTRAASGMTRALLDGMQDSADRIVANHFPGDQATIHAIHRDLESGQVALNQVGIDGLFTAAFLAYLDRAIERGEQDHDPAAAFHHIRRAPVEPE